MFLFHMIILMCVNFAFSSSCTSQTPCRCVLPNNTAIDLSRVGSPEYPRFYEVSFEKNCSIIELYSYNPCFPFDSSDKHTSLQDGHDPCVGAAACVRTPGNATGQFPEEYAIGLQNTAQFNISTGTNFIKYSVLKSKKQLIVNLICKKDTEDILEMLDPGCKSSTIVLELTSKCACADGCSSAIPADSSSGGLSVGSKLLIAFFTILLGYFLLGVLWNYCNGSQGVELIPNLEFWNDLPTVIMEGVVFTCSCCGTRSSYGEV